LFERAGFFTARFKGTGSDIHIKRSFCYASPI
jgi:hypothetical protein